MQELTLAVVGIDFPNADGSNRRSEAMMTLPGDPVTLSPEPKNKHDRNAIAVLGPHGVQLGYVSAERASFIAGRMSRGEEVAAIFQGMDGRAAFIRLRFGGGVPTLPIRPVTRTASSSSDDLPDRPETDAGDSFVPDEDGPEWGA
ncbi:hypothetical protein D9601_12530 [Sphingomonas sp. MA1305]|nr:hypothetical protein [Sphingomonas sp. MA1305]